MVKGGCQSTCITEQDSRKQRENNVPAGTLGVGAIAPAFAMLARAKRASHIDPPASSYAIMRRACPYRGENPEPGKDVLESLTTGPELENRLGQKLPCPFAMSMSALLQQADVPESHVTLSAR
jgi:hypothetical protein